ncbi:hypothetical protein RUND412_007337 [Rhizina undulata]
MHPKSSTAASAFPVELVSSPAPASTRSPKKSRAKKSQKPSFLPDYLLTDILVHLDTFTLLRCRSVCRFWKWNIENRSLLKAIIFTQPPPPVVDAPAKIKDLTLHPVFRLLDYRFRERMYYDNDTVGLLRGRVDFRLNFFVPADSPVVGNYATQPAVRDVVLKLCGGEMVVKNENGVTVWDMMEALDALVRDRHSLPESTPSEQHFLWDHRSFPFAGFRYIPNLSSPSRTVLKPEFHNLIEHTRQLSRASLSCSEISALRLVTFDSDDEYKAEFGADVLYESEYPWEEEEEEEEDEEFSDEMDEEELIGDDMETVDVETADGDDEMTPETEWQYEDTLSGLEDEEGDKGVTDLASLMLLQLEYQL